ncbi:MAG: ComEC family competence protein, partial [Roseiflexus sp.]|nr:ComEC family competence protein [Roseiflexus sp.]
MPFCNRTVKQLIRQAASNFFFTDTVALAGWLTMTLIILAIAWMVGVFLADALHLPLWHLIAGSVGCGVAAIVLRQRPLIRMVFLVLCVATAGG